jgi:hypothetical protein
MKYIYITDEFNQKMCEAFDIEYHLTNTSRISVSKTESILPSNVGIDIGVPGKAPWNKGIKTGALSAAHKESLSIANKGHIKSAEHRLNLSKSLAGNINGKNNTKPKSIEHRQKLRESTLKQWADKKV